MSLKIDNKVFINIFMVVPQCKLLPARASEQGNVIGLVSMYIYIYYIPPPLTVHFSMTRSVRYQHILHTLYYMLHTEHAYCLSYRFLPARASEQGNEIGLVSVYIQVTEKPLTSK